MPLLPVVLLLRSELGVLCRVLLVLLGVRALDFVPVFVDSVVVSAEGVVLTLLALPAVVAAEGVVCALLLPERKL